MMNEGNAVESFPEQTVFDLYGLERGKFPPDEFFDKSIPNRKDLERLEEVFQNLESDQLKMIVLGKVTTSRVEVPEAIMQIWNYLDNQSNMISIISDGSLMRTFQMRSTQYEFNWQGVPLRLHCVVDQGPVNFRVGLTLYNNVTNQAIAFRDLEGRYYERELDQNNSYGHHGPAFGILDKSFILAKNSIEGRDIYLMQGIPGFDIGIRRNTSDTFYVSEPYRGEGLGELLFFSSLELSRRFGAQVHHISHDESRRGKDKGSYYAKFLDTTLSGSYHGWIFPLSLEAISKVTQFKIKKRR
jgi:GNAT superfamily N-acetyltransferase